MTWKLKLWLLASLAVSLWSLRSYINSGKKTKTTTAEFIKHLGE